MKLLILFSLLAITISANAIPTTHSQFLLALAVEEMNLMITAEDDLSSDEISKALYTLHKIGRKKLFQVAQLVTIVKKKPLTLYTGGKVLQFPFDSQNIESFVTNNDQMFPSDKNDAIFLQMKAQALAKRLGVYVLLDPSLNYVEIVQGMNSLGELRMFPFEKHDIVKITISNGSQPIQDGVSLEFPYNFEGHSNFAERITKRLTACAEIFAR